MARMPRYHQKRSSLWRMLANSAGFMKLIGALPCLGRLHRAFEGPGADMVDLLVHGAREGNDLGGDADEVGIGELAVFQPGAGDGGDHALLDLRAGPADG